MQEVEALLRMGDVAGEGWHPAPGVTFRRLYFDDISTEISEQLGAIGPLGVRQVQNMIWGKRSLLLAQDDTSATGLSVVPQDLAAIEQSRSSIELGGAYEYGACPNIALPHP